MDLFRQQLRDEFQRLLSDRTEFDSFEALKKVVDSALILALEFNGKNFSSQKDGEGTILFQMIIVKSVSVLKLVEGINLINEVNTKIRFNNFIDPFSVWTLVRSQFKGFCNFNNIYVNHSTEYGNLLYDLWVLSGLSYRQTFGEIATTAENKSKVKREQSIIDELKDKVFNSSLYSILDQKEKEKIDKAIKDKSFQYYFKDQKLLQGHWHQLLKNSGVSSLFDRFYAFLSLNTHPSNVSVFQFDNMFKEGNDRDNAFFALRVSTLLLSFSIRDLIYYYPELKVVFDKLPLINQLLINSINRTFRGQSFEINDSYKHL